MRSRPQHRPGAPGRGRERGSVFLVVLVVVALLSGLAISAAVRTESSVSQQRNERLSVGSEFAAESAVDYARRRLLLDENWTGTGEDGVGFGGHERFAVSVAEANPGTGDGLYLVEASGENDSGRRELAAEVLVLPGVDPDAQVALAFLGEDVSLADSTVMGDLLIVDEAHVVRDLVNGEYADGGPDGPFSIDFPGTAVNGDLYKYSDTQYFVGNQEKRVGARMDMPEFDLDEYLVPGPDRVIYYYENNLKDVSHPETAVFVLNPGANLSLDGCNFPGGIIVHVDSDYDLRSGPRNKVLLKHDTHVGGGTGGVSPYIGFVGPATEIQFTHTGCAWVQDKNDIDGFTLVNEVHMIREGQLNGQLIVINRIEHFRDTVLTFDQAVADNPPSGIYFKFPGGDTDLVRMWERYGQ